MVENYNVLKYLHVRKKWETRICMTVPYNENIELNVK